MLYLDSSNVKIIRTVVALGGKHCPLVQSQSCCCLQQNFTQPFSGQFNIPNIFINDFYYFSVLCIVPLYDSICTCITLSLRNVGFGVNMFWCKIGAMVAPQIFFLVGLKLSLL